MDIVDGVNSVITHYWLMKIAHNIVLGVFMMAVFAMVGWGVARLLKAIEE